MIALTASTVSLALASGLLVLSKRFVPARLIWWLPLITPLSVGIMEGFSSSIVSLTIGLTLLAATGYIEEKNTLLKLFFLALSALVFSFFGFRIEFIQAKPGGNFIYFTWLSVPLTVTWLFLISRSVEFIHKQMGNKKSRLFFTTLLFITLAVILIISMQQEQNLRLAFQLGASLIGMLAALLIFTPKGKPSTTISLQLGFILASLALFGVVKSITAFVLLVPIAPLVLPVLPVAKRSLAFTTVFSLTEDNPGPINWITEKYVGSSHVGTVLLYLTMSYLGMAFSLLIWNPGTVTWLVLILGFFILPIMFPAAGKLVRHFESWKPGLDVDRHGRVSIFGISFNFGQLKEARDELIKLTRTKPTTYVATPDVTAVVKAQNNELLSDTFTHADVVIPDGFGLVWACSVHNLPLKNRVAGIDLIHETLSSANNKLEVYLLGSKPGVARQAGAELNSSYANIEIVGTHHGYFPINSSAPLSEINQTSPDLLLVGMGVPKQERWIKDNLDQIDANVVMGVGGSFDVISGNLPRAPVWMRERGLEWLYRIRLEPERLIKARSIPYFMGKVIWEKAKLALRDEVL